MQTNTNNNAGAGATASSYKTNSNMSYMLYNEELGYSVTCPVYETKEEANEACAGKCRRHRVVEAHYIEPCVPVAMHTGCLKCARCAAPVEMRRQFAKCITSTATSSPICTANITASSTPSSTPSSSAMVAEQAADNQLIY